MSEYSEGFEVQQYEPRQFFLIVGLITVGSTFIYLMCMCMHKFHCFIDAKRGDLNSKLQNFTSNIFTKKFKNIFSTKFNKFKKKSSAVHLPPNPHHHAIPSCSRRFHFNWAKVERSTTSIWISYHATSTIRFLVQRHT